MLKYPRILFSISWRSCAKILAISFSLSLLKRILKIKGPAILWDCPLQLDGWPETNTKLYFRVESSSIYFSEFVEKVCTTNTRDFLFPKLPTLWGEQKLFFFLFSHLLFSQQLPHYICNIFFTKLCSFRLQKRPQSIGSCSSVLPLEFFHWNSQVL